MKSKDRPALLKTSKLEGVSDVSFQERGKDTFSIKFEPFEMEVEATVAEINDNGLLGVDILQNVKDSPTDIMLSKWILMIDNK